MTAESPRSGQSPEPRPVGPLGAAFADLVEDPPPSDLTARDVMVLDWAAREQRGAWVRRIGVAAAVVVIGGLGVLGVRSLGGISSETGTGGGGPGGAVISDATGAAAPQFPGTASRGDVNTGSVTELSSCPPSVGLSAAQTAVVLAQLPGSATAPSGCGTGIGRQPATGAFRAGAMFIEVEIAEPPGEACPMLVTPSPPRLCVQVDGHPGVLLSYAPGDGQLSQASLVRVGLVSGSRGVTVRVLGFDGAPNPFTADQLATLVETLARTS